MKYGDGDQNKGKKGADVGEVRHGADVQQAAGNADHKASDPGGHCGGAEARVDAAEDGGQQTVARHGKPDARLAQLEDEDGRDHAQHGADEDKEPNPSAGCRCQGSSASFLIALTTGAASPITDCQGTMPLSTMATAP